MLLIKRAPAQSVGVDEDEDTSIIVRTQRFEPGRWPWIGLRVHVVVKGCGIVGLCGSSP